MAYDEFKPILESSKWDWYQVTISYYHYDKLRPILSKFFPNAVWRLDRPVNGYQSAEGLYIGDRRCLLACYGGNNDTCNLLSTSSDSVHLYDALHAWGGAFKPTRFDSCIDWEEPGLFDCLSSSLLAFATEKGLLVNQQGDWERGRSRTLYIGSSKSPVQIRLYEKGYEMLGLDTDRPNWVRLEVQVKPTKSRRASTCTWSPSDAFCCGWVSEAIQRFFILPQCKHPIGYEKTDSDRLRRRKWLFKVAARALRELLEDHSGDLESFAKEISESITVES
jgi:hypothetical protein